MLYFSTCVYHHQNFNSHNLNITQTKNERVEKSSLIYIIAILNLNGRNFRQEYFVERHPLTEMCKSNRKLDLLCHSEIRICRLPFSTLVSCIYIYVFYSYLLHILYCIYACVVVNKDGQSDVFSNNLIQDYFEN